MTLKSCLYCRGDGVRVRNVFGATVWHTVCDRCLASGAICVSEADAVEVHNKMWERLEASDGAE